MQRKNQETLETTSVAEQNMLDTEPPEAPIEPETLPQDGHRFAKLVATNGTAERIGGQEEIWINRRQMTIGRAPTCDFVIDSPILDAEHCIITVQRYDEVFVRDLSSVNGTYVNGERVSSTEETFIPIGSELSLTKQLTFELWEPDKELQDEDYLSSMIKSTTLLGAESVPFKPLPGIRYSPDDGPPIDDNYSPT